MMRFLNRLTCFLLLFVLVLSLAYRSGNGAVLQAPQQDMSKWVGKYPDKKFYSQPLIRNSLRRILSKADYASIDDYNLMVPIDRVGDYLLAHSTIKYSEPNESLDLAFNLKDNSVYIVFWKGDDNPTHRKFSTKKNRFDLPDDVLKELGLKDE